MCYLAPFIHPSTFKLIPFFGLAYPIVLLINLFFLIAYAIVKSRWFFYVLAVLLIGGKLNLRMIGFGSDKNKLIPDKTIKLLSYNVRLFDVYNAGFNQDFKNRDSIFSFLKNEQADIVCFQEFYIQDDPKKKPYPTKDTLMDLMKTTQFHSRMTFNKYFKNYFGVAMFSKYPMITKGHIDFDDTIGNTNNFCIFSDIVIDKDTIRFYNAHFQSIRFQQDDYALFNDNQITGETKSNVLGMFKKLHLAYQKRAGQAQKVIEHMKQSPYPVVIAGDFNDTPMSYTYNLFYSNYVDVFKNCATGFGITYAGKVPAGRIDYIFHSTNIESVQFKIQKSVFSDHRAISCNLWKKKS
jgi:endonuclease/exonuclease/phosphatase family metal-dependent hydrolase